MIFLAEYAPIFAIPIVAILVTYILSKVSHLSLPQGGRSVTIDGLRGYLALFVVTHHASIWHSYIKTGVWALPDNRIYSNIGQVGVVFFFMITGFLFISKIRKSNDINWTRLYESRIKRLGPLFLFAFLTMLLIVGAVTGWTLQVSEKELAISIARWMPFAMLGMPHINGLEDTSVIGGVSWSLVYEWFFYLSLPVAALILKKKVPVLLVSFSVLSLAAFVVYPVLKIHVLSFIFGAIASYAVDKDMLRRVATNRLTSILVTMLIIGSLVATNQSYSPVSIGLAGISFVLISCGNDLFGLLKLKLSRFLGESTYSIYLLHQIVFYIAFKCTSLGDVAITMSSESYWMVIFCIIPIITVICHLTYKYIELPGMNSKLSISSFRELWAKSH